MSTVFSSLLLYIALLIVLIGLAGDISAIKCWRCKSDESFCQDTLDPTNLTKDHLDWFFVKCSPPRIKFNYNGDSMISKCSIRIDLAYKQRTYTRKCLWEAENAAPNSCARSNEVNEDNPNVEVLSCETCVQDGCNAKIKNYFEMELEPITNSFGIKSAFIRSTHIELVMMCLILTMLRFWHR